METEGEQTTAGLAALQQIARVLDDATRLPISLREINQLFAAVEAELRAGLANAQELGKVKQEAIEG